MEKLGLKTINHSSPYYLQWLNDEESFLVKEQVFVPFSIGRYKDEILCDIMPMNTSHLLLGRPWQFDKQATHDGFTNRFSFSFEGRNITLAPLSPQQVKEDQMQLKKNIEAMKGIEKIEEKEVDVRMVGVENTMNKNDGVENEIIEKNMDEKEEKEETCILSNPTFSPITSFVLQDNPWDTTFQTNDSRIMPFGELKDVSFKGPLAMTFGDRQDKSFDVSKVMTFEFPTVAIVDIPSVLPILKRIQQPMPIKHPPWFAISFQLVVGLFSTKHGSFCSKFINLHGIVLACDDQFKEMRRALPIQKNTTKKQVSTPRGVKIQRGTREGSKGNML